MFVEWLRRNRVIDFIEAPESFHPYPKASERDKWENIPEEVASACVRQAEKYLGFEWPSLPATSFMAYMRTGDRRVYEDRHFPRRRALAALVLGECVEGKGRFIDDIINGIWCICEESFWGVSAHNGVRANEPLPDVEDRYIDLFAAETGGLLAWTKYLLADELDKVTHLVSRRIDIELEERIKKPFLCREDFWWMGTVNRAVNNWAPWIVANVMSVFLLCEPDSVRRAKAIEKMFRCLDCFVNSYHDDGGCDEGTSYWNVAGGALFDCLDQLYKASSGKIDFFQNELVRQIGRYIYRCHIADKYFINFADGGARIDIAKDMIYRYGKRIGDPAMVALAVGVPTNADFRSEALRRALPAIFNYAELASQKSEPPYVRDVWMDGIQVMVAREKAGSAEGLYLAAKGGHNAESHNHNDVGSCIVFVDGLPGIIDVGVETYTKKTFSSQRYEIWTMQSQYHNLPTINGKMQSPGGQYRATNVKYDMSDDEAVFSLDINNAYPKDANVKLYSRTYRMHRKESEIGYIEITDSFVLETGEGTICWNFMVWKKPEVIESGLIKVKINEETAFYMQFSEENVKVDIEHCDTSDARLRSAWGADGVYRIVMTKTVPKEGCFSVKVYKA